MKEKIKNISALLILLLSINAIYIAFIMATEGTCFGQTNFFDAFITSTAFEVCFFLSLSVIFYLMYRLIKTVIKGVQEEKERYGDK